MVAACQPLGGRDNGCRVIGLVVAGAGQSVTEWLGAATITGPPVKVRVDAQPLFDDMSVPRDQSLSASDLGVLSKLNAQDADAWLVKHKKAIPAYHRSIVLTLTGNRQDTVRLMDMGVDSTCTTPDRGTLVRQASGRGAGADSEHLAIYPEEDDPGPFQEGTQSHYFPERTITLKQHEQVVAVIDVESGWTGMDDEDPASTRACEFALTLRVLEGDTETAEAIPGTFTIMDVEPVAAENSYRQVYIGTGLCDGFYEAPANWSSDDFAVACGAGNLKP